MWSNQLKNHKNFNIAWIQASSNRKALNDSTQIKYFAIVLVVAAVALLIAASVFLFPLEILSILRINKKYRWEIRKERTIPSFSFRR